MPDPLSRFIESYHGSSFPTLAELASGRRAVIKLRGTGNGPEAQVSEFVVNRLAHRAGFPVPDAWVVDLPEDMPWVYGTDEFHDLVVKSPGPNLALAVIDRAQPLPVERYAGLPRELVAQIVTLDRVFSNWDRSDLSGNLVTDAAGQVWLIDHGSCRFLHEPVADTLPPLPANHSFVARRDGFDATWLDLITAEVVQAVVGAIPDAWLSEIRRPRAAVADVIHRRLALARRRDLPLA